MMTPEAASPPPARRGRDLRAGLVAAGLMLSLSLTTKLVARLGWANTRELSERSLMVILSGLIVATGNTIPKRFVSRACFVEAPSAAQAFLRLSGWTWVLAGIALGLANALLPDPLAVNSTFVLMPLAMAIVFVAWLRLPRGVSSPRP